MMEEYYSSEEMSSIDDSSENDEPVFEKCLVDGTLVSLPHDMCDQKSTFFQVMNLDIWESLLTNDQKNHLKQFLPTFQENDEEEKNKSIQLLFSEKNVKFGNPLDKFFKKLKGGFYAPGVAKIDNLVKKARYKEYRNQQYHYFYQLLQDVIISRKLLLDAASGLPPHHPIHVPSHFPPTKLAKPNVIESRTKWRYFTELQEVREECGELDTSEEDENYPDKSLPKLTKKLKKQLHSMDGALSPDLTRICSTTSSLPSYAENGVSAHIAMYEVTEAKYKEMLARHKRRRLSKDRHPELNVEGITLEDILVRTNVNKRPFVKSESSSKKKIKEELKITAEELASQPEDEMEVSDQDERISPSVQVQPCCFFSLLRDFFYETAEQKMSASKLEEKVRCWQEVPCTLEWSIAHENWTEHVPSSLKFLAGDLIGILPENFVPYLDYKEKQQQWQWIGAGRDSEELLGGLCQHWMDNKEDLYTDSLECTQGSVPPPRVVTDWSVRPTTDIEKSLYQEQECIRYQNPHKAFTFRVHGYESVVGPVKGVYGKESGVNKAREHSLLVSDRPPFVTILSLVRDAAARLPNGEGTRADICELLKDSQYLAPANDQQIHTVVSGALDRLHYEKDPCVKYDVNRKLWIYLHRNRTEEEFERIHQAQAAAAKAKKAIQKNKLPRIQKIKATVDPDSNSAEHGRSSASPRTQPSPKPKPIVRSHTFVNTQQQTSKLVTVESASQQTHTETTLSMLVQSPNSRPPSQGSLPSPKTVIANVNAAQFVGQNCSDLPRTPSPPVTTVNELCPSSPSWVGQPSVLQSAKRTLSAAGSLSGFQTFVIKQEGGKPSITALPLTTKTKPMMARVMSLSNLVATKPPSAQQSFRFQGNNFIQPVVATGTPLHLSTASKLQSMGTVTTSIGSVQPKLITLNPSMIQFDPSTGQNSATSVILASSSASSSSSTPTAVLLTSQSGGLKPTNQTYVMTTPGGSSPTVVMATNQRGGCTPINLKTLQGIKVIPMSQAVKSGQPLLARILTPSGGAISLRPPTQPPKE